MVSLKLVQTQKACDSVKYVNISRCQDCNVIYININTLQI